MRIRFLLLNAYGVGGTIRTSRPVRSAADLPAARAFLFDTDPRQLADIAGPALPSGYVRRLRRYRYGPGIFKMDFALDGPIPWSDPRCLEASTVHVGGTLAEIAAATGAPQETVKSRLRLARQALRQTLERAPGMLEVLEGDT